MFQFRGHSWTLIHQLSRKAALKEQDAEALAGQLNTETIYYIVSDTGHYTRYRFYDSTGLIESLSFEGWNSPLQFESKRRQLSNEAIGDAYTFTSKFMKEHGVYVPMIFLPKMTVAQRLVLRIEAHIDPPSSPAVPGATLPITLERSDFNRCDHVGIETSQS